MRSSSTVLTDKVNAFSITPRDYNHPGVSERVSVPAKQVYISLIETILYGGNIPTIGTPVVYLDHFDNGIILQEDLGVNPGYSHLLDEQYTIDLRKNPALRVLAGVFRGPTQTLPSGQGRDSPVPRMTSRIECSASESTSETHTRGPSTPRGPNQPALHPAASPVPSTSAASSSYEKTHICTYCGTAFDRFTRARDCRNMDLGLTPHACLGRCGKPGW